MRLIALSVLALAVTTLGCQHQGEASKAALKSIPLVAPPVTSSTTTSSTSSTTTTSAPAPRTLVTQQVSRRAASPRAGAVARASWYGVPGITFAHKTMAKGTRVRFCHEGRCVVATCTDRGPYIAGRTFDLSRDAFAAIAPLGAGVVDVAWAVVPA